MDSKVNMSKSEQSCIKPKEGYSLKKGKLKKWIYEHGYTQPVVAKVLGIDKAELQRKLREHELFSKEQIKKIVFLVGAEMAIDIIYFPSLKEKNNVRKKTFGNQKRKTDGKHKQTC